MEALVSGVRESESFLGGVRYGPSERERHNLDYRRSIYVVKNINQGEEITEENVRSIRPAAGIHPRHLGEVLGKVSSAFLPAGKALQWEDLE